VRIDKWLWAARLMKTRTDAAGAVKGGRVRVNGEPVKPSREVRPGDHLDITKGTTRTSVVVRGLAERRGPAREAVLLYAETEESRTMREAQAAERRLARPPVADLGGRPTKRDRRRYEQSRAGR
jgi:ribosome-associated heat shock protein Hsp15